MTKRDYELIAEALYNAPCGVTSFIQGGREHLVVNYYILIDGLCETFEKDNPRFDRCKFIEACGLEPWDELVMGVPVKHKKERRK